ncbi:MAG: NAD(P)H-hydrate dehydratase [Nannocystaceae bacterium]
MLWNAARSLAADRYTMDALGMASSVLMERAAVCVAAQLERLALPGVGAIEVLCGPGNNGGDGFALARILGGRGYAVSATQCGGRPTSSTVEQIELARAHGVRVRALHDGLPNDVSPGTVVVDALLGTGSCGAPRGALVAAIAWTHAHRMPTLAIDLPTGVDPDTGRVAGVVIHAQRTVTFQRSKPGLHITPGRGHAGAVVVADIGIVSSDSGYDAELLTGRGVANQVAALCSGRCATHKHRRGHLGILGGGRGTPGAAVLAGTAALRCGTGIVTILSDDAEVRSQLLATRPELMVASRSRVGDPGTFDALVVGPGLTDAASHHRLADLYTSDPRPAVWDASALDHVPFGTQPSASRCLTPHPGEAARLMRRLTGDPWTPAQVQMERRAVVERLAEATAAVVLLKGGGTLIAASGMPLAICPVGSSHLATAGTGDCLSGAVGTWLTMGMDSFRAAQAAAYVHALAGESAARRFPGVVALDVAQQLGPVVAGLSQFRPEAAPSYAGAWGDLRLPRYVYG